MDELKRWTLFHVWIGPVVNCPSTDRGTHWTLQDSGANIIPNEKAINRTKFHDIRVQVENLRVGINFWENIHYKL
jgi:hypothetical protein